ncbi:LysR substrate-binding domain-containing protein [Pseudoruegeria sp. SHC-113]|uniref:LysR substrate-binding domain-containing protein n=1 Tax=Pseudoruegeria sp. SHC-113 TaxID=2855439 RepID=UPI0021BAC2E4|nr:LysR substrate-binding domain-containing protein [Pseudoruegeria sp. SHC-113]MCT8162143.1 LysR family transcriptional regulator [Pseudoruegeria sp. SHC-113]
MNLDSHMRLRHVRCFLEVARAQSVSRAAEALHITQPAVSRSLKELEAMLGTPLFDRVGRGLRLNEAGRVFQAHASAAMVELMRGQERLAQEGDLSRRLSIGALPTASSQLLPRAALAFREEMPHVRLHILTGPNGLLFNQLRDGEVDLVLGRMPEREAGAGVSFQQLYIEDVVLVCRPGHPILNEARPEQAIAAHELILPPTGAVIWETVQRYLASIGLPERRAGIETVSLPVGRGIVGLSDALWFISRGVVAVELAAGSLVAVDLASPLLSGPVGISVARAAPISVERSVFADCLRAVAGGA